MSRHRYPRRKRRVMRFIKGALLTMMIALVFAWDVFCFWVMFR